VVLRFGPTKDAIDSWDYNQFDGSVKKWVKDQIDPSVSGLSSHREFFRERLNPRMDQVYFSGKGGPNPCEVNSRWRKFAFIAKDAVEGNKFMVTPLDTIEGGRSFVLIINGHPRTVVSSIELDGDAQLAVNSEYDLCHPHYNFWREGDGDVFKIQVGSKCYALKDGIPSVDITELEANNSEGEYKLNVIDMSEAKFQGIDDTTYESEYWPTYATGDEFMLEEAFSHIKCESLPKPFSEDGSPVEPIFAKRIVNDEVEYMLYDPHLLYVENTPENPSPDGGGNAVLATDGTMKCSNAPRSFLNEDNCYLSFDENACSPESPAVNTVTLDPEFLAEIDNITGRHLIAFTNLPLRRDIEYYHRDNPKWPRYYIRRGPCSWNGYVYSRFKGVDSSLCDSAPQVMTDETYNLFEQLLSPEFEDPYNPNPVYRDVLKRNTHNCARADKDVWDLGFINQNGTCWQHVRILLCSFISGNIRSPS
jgi:hypothetical protein